MTSQPRLERAFAQIPLEQFIESPLSLSLDLLVLHQGFDMRRDLKMDIFRRQIERHALKHGHRVSRAQRSALGIEKVLGVQVHAVRRGFAQAASHCFESAADVNYQGIGDWRRRDPVAGFVLDFQTAVGRGL